jgi:hypothetical protein
MEQMDPVLWLTLVAATLLFALLLGWLVVMLSRSAWLLMRGLYTWWKGRR